MKQTLILMGDTIALLHNSGREEELQNYDAMEGQPKTTEAGVHYMKYLIDD